MKFWTWAELRGKVEADLDLEEETFITQDELLGYGNEAVDEVERQVHNIYEDYFLTRGTINLVSGTEEYDLPDDIYAMKIRSIVYRNGTSVWKVQKIRDWHKFEQYEVEQTGTSSYSQYGYFLLNQTAGSPKLLLAPTPIENGSFLKIWYLRNANELVDDDSILDIPEAANYIMQYIKVRCYEKEGHPNLEKAMLDLQQEKETTLSILGQMVADNSTEIEPDLRLYEDMS